MKTPAELFSLKGKVAVVIGGTGVLCGEMAEGLAAAGAAVALVGRDAAKAKARLDKIAKDGGKAEFFACDTTSKAGLQQLLADVLKKFGRVDILVNGAGVNSPTPFFDIPEDEFDRIITVNLKGLLLACQVFGKHMVEQKSGSIINLGSASGLTPLSRVFTYSASKAAVHNLVEESRARMGHCRRAREYPGARIFPGGTEPQGAQSRARGADHGQDADETFRRGAGTHRRDAVAGVGRRQFHHRRGNSWWTAASTR